MFDVFDVFGVFDVFDVWDVCCVFGSVCMIRGRTLHKM